MGDNTNTTPSASLWLSKKLKEKRTKKKSCKISDKPKSVLSEQCNTSSDLRPLWMKQYQDKNSVKEDFESEPNNINDIAHDIVTKSDVMGRVLKGVSMNSRFKTANEPDGTPLPTEKADELDVVKETPLSDINRINDTSDEMGNARNLSTNPIDRDIEDAKMHVPNGKELDAVIDKELTISGKNKIILTYEEAQKIIERFMIGITIEWK